MMRRSSNQQRCRAGLFRPLHRQLLLSPAQHFGDVFHVLVCLPCNTLKRSLIYAGWVDWHTVVCGNRWHWLASRAIDDSNRSHLGTSAQEIADRGWSVRQLVFLVVLVDIGSGIRSRYPAPHLGTDKKAKIAGSRDQHGDRANAVVAVG